MVDVGAVLDTGPLLFYTAGVHRNLGKAARRLLAGAEVGRWRLVVPTICLFEVAQLEEKGRIQLHMAFEEWCGALEATDELLVLPLERPHVSEARSLPSLRDPFDRLIAGTAVALGVPLVTADARIAASPRVRVAW